jgi:hypothetical protein
VQHAPASAAAKISPEEAGQKAAQGRLDKQMLMLPIAGKKPAKQAGENSAAKPQRRRARS